MFGERVMAFVDDVVVPTIIIVVVVLGATQAIADLLVWIVCLQLTVGLSAGC